MKFYFSLFLLLTLDIAFSQSMKADSQLYKLYVDRGNVIYGYIIDEDKDSITIDGEHIGLLKISKEYVSSISKTSGPRQYTAAKELMYKDNYFYTETAFTPKEGSFYLQNNYALSNRVTFAPVNHIAIEGGFYFEPYNFEQVGAVLAIKAGVSLYKSIHIGAKSQLFEGTDGTRAQVHSGILTLGNINNNFTMGVHWSKVNDYFDSEFGRKNILYSFGGTVAINKKNAIKFEHINFRNNVSMLNVGMSLNTKTLSFSYGISFYTTDEEYDDYPPLPFLSLKIPLRS